MDYVIIQSFLLVIIVDFWCFVYDYDIDVIVLFNLFVDEKEVEYSKEIDKLIVFFFIVVKSI